MLFITVGKCDNSATGYYVHETWPSASYNTIGTEMYLPARGTANPALGCDSDIWG
jgi:hypothetical protein